LPTPTASGPITQTATPLPTPLPTATPISKESALTAYQNYLTAVGVTDGDYRKYVEMNLYSDKMRQAIGSAVPTTTEQIKFKYIRIDTAAVPTVTEALKQDGFLKVYDAILSNTVPYSSSVVAQAIDQWVPIDAISTTTEWGLLLRQRCLPRRSARQRASFQYDQYRQHVGFIEAKGIEPLASTFLNQAQDRAVEAWLQQRRNRPSS
jgi:hypothetical protein